MKWVLSRYKYKRIGLALGGGGARGFAHLGVLKAFEEHNIKFDFVAGTSVGSLVGAVYCKNLSVEKMIELCSDLDLKSLRTNKIPLIPSKIDGLKRFIESCVGEDTTFNDLNIPLACVAVDIIEGKEHSLMSGNLSQAVAASCAVPGIFQPVEIDKYRFYDGGLCNTIPSSVAKENHCDAVVAVDINSTRGSGTESTKLTDLLGAALGVCMKNSAIKGYLNAEIVLQPNMKRFRAYKKDGCGDMIEEGYNAAMEKMSEIKALFRKSKAHWKRMKREDKVQQKLRQTNYYEVEK